MRTRAWPKSISIMPRRIGLAFPRRCPTNSCRDVPTLTSDDPTLVTYVQSEIGKGKSPQPLVRRLRIRLLTHERDVPTSTSDDPTLVSYVQSEIGKGKDLSPCFGGLAFAF
jgi:hypothetical protein